MVSRNPKTRAVAVRYDGAAPQAGVAIVAGERQVGIIGSAAAGRGLALLRLDRAAEAMSRGEPLFGGGIKLTIVKPDWARFPFPGETKFPGDTKAAE